MEYIEKELDKVSGGKLYALLHSDNRHLVELVISIIVIKNDRENEVITNSKYFDTDKHNYYPDYLGYYLSYAYRNNNQERINQIKDIINKKNDDLRILTGKYFLKSYIANLYNDYNKDVDILRFLMEFVYNIGDGSENLNNILIGLFNNNVDKNIIKDAYRKAKDIRPVGMILDLIIANTGFSKRVMSFLMGVYIGNELSLDEVKDLINSRGNTKSKRWLDEMMLNQV